MFERFTDRARRVVVLAQEHARTLSHDYIGTEHLLLGLIAEGTGVGAKALESLGIELTRVQAEVTRMIGEPSASDPSNARRTRMPWSSGHIPFTPRAKKVLELALREALSLDHNYIGTEHILLGLSREGDGVGAQVLVLLGATPARVRETVIDLLRGFTAPPASPPTRVGDHGSYSPGLRGALELAEAAAGVAGSESTGTHHVLSVFAEWDDLAANAILRAGGFDASKLDRAIVEWDVSYTRDETESERSRRVTTVTTDDDAIVVRVVDADLLAKVRAAIEAGQTDDLGELLGDALRKAAGKNVDPPPADPAADEG